MQNGKGEHDHQRVTEDEKGASLGTGARTWRIRADTRPLAEV